MTTDLKKLIVEARELAERSTLGPAEKVLSADGNWRIRFPEIPRGFNGECYGWATFYDENDAEFDCFTRNNLLTFLDELERLQKREMELQGAGQLLQADNDRQSRALEVMRAELNSQAVRFKLEGCPIGEKTINAAIAQADAILEGKSE